MTANIAGRSGDEDSRHGRVTGEGRPAHNDLRPFHRFAELAPYAVWPTGRLFFEYINAEEMNQRSGT